MELSARRPHAAAGAAVLAAGLIAVIPAVAPKISATHVQSPAVELASADAFLDLANALDPSASTDGLIGVANNLDSFLDLFGTPTVNVIDTLTSDFITDFGVGNEVAAIDAALTADFSGLDTLISGLDSDLSVPFTTLLDEIGVLTTDLTGGFSGVDGGLSTLDTTLGQIDSDIVGVDSDLDLGFRNLFDALTTDLSPLSTIATELGNTGVLAGDLTSLYAILADIYIDE
jgi:hypothetical protein